MRTVVKGTLRKIHHYVWGSIWVTKRNERESSRKTKQVKEQKAFLFLTTKSIVPGNPMVPRKMMLVLIKGVFTVSLLQKEKITWRNWRVLYLG